MYKIDQLVAEKVMGENLKPHKDVAMVAIGRKYIAVTGPVFELTTGDQLPIPRDLDVLRIPEGSKDINDRYCLYVAEFLGERIADEVDSYRLGAKPYSTNIQYAWKVAEKFSYDFRLRCSLGYWTCSFVYKMNDEGVGQYVSAEAKTAEMAICIAALRSVGAAEI